MQKKMQKWVVGVIVLVLSVSLIGTSFVAIFQPEESQVADTQALDQEYAQRKQIVELLSKKLEGNSEDIDTQIALGDAYYDKSRVTGQLNLEEFKGDLQNAINMYQQVLVKKEDNVVMLKLAASAFLLGDGELADKTYQELLVKEPENVDALYGYGMFLFYEKNDHKKAEENWQKALSLTTDEQYKERLNEMIAVAQGMDLKASEEKEK